MTQQVLLVTDLVSWPGAGPHLEDFDTVQFWAKHHRMAGELLRSWDGREVDKSDGHVILFQRGAYALDFLLAYQQALRTLTLSNGVQAFSTRAGLHVCALMPFERTDVANSLGARSIETDGKARAIAVRVMKLASGGQILLTRDALEALGTLRQRVVSHGYWDLKGLRDPMELFEVGDADAPFVSPPNSPHGHRIVRA